MITPGRSCAVMLLACCIAVVAVSQDASAQEEPQDPVADAPMRLGVAGVAPTFAITNLGVDTNVFNSTTDPRRDFTLTASPGAKVWLRTARGLVSFDGRVDLVYFARFATERSANVSGSIRYEYDFARVRPFVSYSVLGTRERPGYEIDERARRLEDGITAGAVVPVGTLSTFELVRRRNRVVFDGEAFFNGQPLKQSLDRTLDAWDVTWRQPLTVVTTWLVRASRERERFSFTPDRNSNSVHVSSGFELGLLALIRGTAFVGYRRLTGAEGGTLAEFSGVVADVDVSYTAPSQTRLGFAVNRDLHYSFEPEQPYYVQTGWTVSGTQRIIGRWDVQVNGGRDRLAYRTGASVLARRDRITRLGGGIGYEVGDAVRIGFDMQAVRRHAPLAARDYTAFKTGVSVTYGY
jgi:hypothetical protein